MKPLARTALPTVALGLLLAAGGAGPAAAEMYRCAGADGEVLFTSDPSQCPGAEAHEPAGAVQRHEATHAPPAATRSRSAEEAHAESDRARAARWRTKRVESERRLVRVEELLESSRRSVRWCNEGRDVYVTEEDTGLRRRVPCRKIDARHADLQAEREELRAYLDEGLQEECRRAGCLPGWIRE